MIALRWMFLPAAAALLTACGLPAPTTHVQLDIRANGDCVLDHAAIALADLPRLLAERHARQPDLLLQVHAAPEADIHTVQQAVQVAQMAHVRVAFANQYNAQQ